MDHSLYRDHSFNSAVYKLQSISFVTDQCTQAKDGDEPSSH